jgi:hypothetical protein
MNTEKQWDSVNPLLSPVCIVEVRGAKTQTIKWTDKQTRREESMEKYAVAGEFEDGTQVILSQIGRDFTGTYPFERGKRYVFSLKGYEIDRDTINAEFAAVAPVDAVPLPISANGSPTKSAPQPSKAA